MNRVYPRVFLLSLLALSILASGLAYSTPQNKEHHGEAQLDSRIEQWVQKTCGDDAVCVEKKRAAYIERMEKYKAHVQKKCGEDKICRQEVRTKYMERRAKKEARIAKHCGDDEACRDELREKYNERMTDARKKCGEDKRCWKQFYNEHKPE